MGGSPRPSPRPAFPPPRPPTHFSHQPPFDPTTSSPGSPTLRGPHSGARASVGSDQPLIAGGLPASGYASLPAGAILSLAGSPLTSWTPIGVGIWVGAPTNVGGLGLPQAARILDRSCIDGALLRTMSESDLELVGLTDPRHRATLVQSLSPLLSYQSQVASAQARVAKAERERAALRSSRSSTPAAGSRSGPTSTKTTTTTNDTSTSNSNSTRAPEVAASGSGSALVPPPFVWVPPPQKIPVSLVETAKRKWGGEKKKKNVGRRSGPNDDGPAPWPGQDSDPGFPGKVSSYLF